MTRMMHRRARFLWPGLLLAALLPGCAGMLGVTRLAPRADERLVLAPRPGDGAEGDWAVARREGVLIKAHWIPAPEPVATRYNFFGRISHYVTPYTHQTSIVRLRVENNSERYLTVATEAMELEVPNAQAPLRPLPLDYFKRHWPLYAVRNDGMVRDQSLAISHVIRTLFTSRTLRPGEQYEGLVPFPRVPAGTAQARLLLRRVQLDAERFDLSVDFARVTTAR